MDIKRMQDVAADYARYTRQADERALEPLKELYTAGLESPSTTRIIICDAGRNSGKYLEDVFIREAVEIGLKEASKNYQQGLFNTVAFGKLLDKCEEIEPLLNEFINKFNELYPLTGPLRAKLMDKARVTMGDTIPKMSFFEKLLHWRNSVPKEFSKMLKKAAK